MQQEIFLNMAVAHEAYLDGGMNTIERLYADDPYHHGAAAIAAWRRIDEGGATNVPRGTGSCCCASSMTSSTSTT